MRNTIPDYIADSGNLVLNIILTTVFAVIFIAVYALFSQTIWFDLHDESRFLFTAGFISASELLLIISNTVVFAHIHFNYYFQLHQQIQDLRCQSERNLV